MSYKEEVIFNKFLKEVIKSESSRKSYGLMYGRLLEVEKILGKNAYDIETDEEFNTLIEHCCKSKTYNSAFVKFSLVKKYMNYIGNENINKVTSGQIKKNIIGKAKVEGMNRYLSKEELFQLIDKLENYSDRCLVMLARSGFGLGYESQDLINLKVSDVDLKNGTVKGNKLDKDIMYLVEKTIEERDYVSLGSYDKIIVYNPDSEYLFKTRPTKITNDGLLPFKPSGFRGRLQKIRTITDDRVVLSNLNLSFLVDDVLEYQKIIHKTLTQIELRNYLKNKYNMTKNVYDVKCMVDEIKI